ncbi:DUF2690 domain-containing protein [Streptomyces sp. NPDC014983]|uniref:DUF2690 domain-containing protein n=1 Tax=Streptomyces sp. NPDC014983 TaxID=3364933 RepID=UPI003701CA78
MPRWKTLPNELDPEIKEFVSQLRWLVDLGGLDAAALADRTGYGRASWDSYLDGRLLAPKGAAVALAEAAGTSPVPIITMWELAERAWSRAELGYEHTGPARRASGGPAVRAVNGTEGGTLAVPRVPAQPTAAEAGERGGTAAGASGGNSWGLAGYRGPSRASAKPGARPEPVAADAPEPRSPQSPRSPQNRQGSQGSQGLRSPQEPRRSPQEPDAVRPSGARPGYRQPMLMFLAGFVAVLLIILGVVHFTGSRAGGRHEAAAKRPAPSASPKASLPPGVECTGSGCVGKDAESMGCSGDQVTTAQTVTLGATTLEVRYSKVCGTAWGRITGAVPGDKVEVTGARARVREAGQVTQVGDTIAYTPMIAVRDPGEARACATLASGRTGCTR